MLTHRVTTAIILVFTVLITTSFHSLIRTAPSSAFRLPVLPGVTVKVMQGNNQGDHIAANGSEYAFDFAVNGQPNFVITAAQGGTVIGADDSSTTGCGDESCWKKANYVLIADDDGTTAALYLHLLHNSLKVTLGMHVSQGQPLGLADTTGWATGPHLHFQVENIPSASAQQQKYPGWWWTQSVPVSFSNPKVLSQDANGVPQEGQSFLVSNNSSPSTIRPGGMWTDPSPQEGQQVTDVITFSAEAYPTHSGDPAIAKVNFTVESNGIWKIACTASPPATGDVFSCDANLKTLGIPYGQIQVSFDVYDQAGNVNLAPNGIHSLSYMPTPVLPPTPVPPTAIPPTPVPPTEIPPTAIPPTPIPPTVIPQTPVPPTEQPPTPTPPGLSSGTWRDPYGGASYIGDSVTLQLVVQGSTVSGTMTGDSTGDSTNVQGQDGQLSSFSSSDQQMLNFVIQNYGSGTGIFLVYTNTSVFEGAYANSQYYAVLQQNGDLQGYWYFPNSQQDAGALDFNIIS